MINNTYNIKMLYPNDLDELRILYLDLINKNMKFNIIGCGSNTLIDENYDGIIINLSKMKYYYKIYEEYIYVSAFYPTNNFVMEMVKYNIDYKEFIMIPGLIGGLVWNNGGAFNKEIGDYIINIYYMNTLGNIVKISKTEALLYYRDSIFKHIKGIIVGIDIKYIKNENIENDIIFYKNKRINNTIKYKNIGSIFKNVDLIKAWRIIDTLNLRGYRINDACFYEKHPNVIINLGDAKFKDIIELINLAKRKAYEELKINLIEEISIIN